MSLGKKFESHRMRYLRQETMLHWWTRTISWRTTVRLILGNASMHHGHRTVNVNLAKARIGRSQVLGCWVVSDPDELWLHAQDYDSLERLIPQLPEGWSLTARLGVGAAQSWSFACRSQTCTAKSTTVPRDADSGA